MKNKYTERGSEEVRGRGREGRKEEARERGRVEERERNRGDGGQPGPADSLTAYGGGLLKY